MQVKSLRGILYISFAVLIFITLFIVGLPMLNMIRGYVGQMSRRQTEQVLYHLEQSLDKTMGRIHRLSDQLTELERLQEFIIARGTPEAESFLNERFAELAQIYDDVVSLFAFEHSSTHRGSEQPVRFVSSRSGFEFNEEKPLREEPWYSSALEAGGTVVITPPHLQNFIKRNYMWVVSLSRRLYAPPDASSPDTPSDSSLNADSPAPAGILLIDITIDVIKDICLKNSSDTHYYYIADPSGTIIFHPKSQLIHSGVFKEPVQQVLQSTAGTTGSTTGTAAGTFSIRIDGRERIYTVRREPLSGWSIIAATDLRSLYAPFFPALSSLAAWAALGIILLLILSRLISTRVLKPLRYLRESIKKVEEGRFDISVPVSDYDEIGALARDFNIMVKKIGDLLALNEEEHRKLRESDFKALQSQINPHFLYNTLDSIIWMTAKGRKNDVITMVSSLAKLLRCSLAGGQSLIPLEEEFDHARQYCTIQKIRYRDKLHCTLELPEECRRLPVPRLILQPLIENALSHGIQNWDKGGRITISAKKPRDALIITVSDNGSGAHIPRLREILTGGTPTGGTSGSTRTGIGLKNINDRLGILFGENSKVDFRSPPRGLEVILTIHSGRRRA